MNKTLRFLSTLAFLVLSGGAYALNITDFKILYGGAAVTFCNLITVENIALENQGFGQVVVFPREIGGYKNISVTSRELDLAIKNCFNSSCVKNVCEKEAALTLVRARKINDSNAAVTEISFDGELAAVFIVTKYKKKGKSVYRVKLPAGLKFENNIYREKVKKFLTEAAKKLL